MSLINQVLKDLDQQRGPADGVQVAALQGIGLVQSRQNHWPAILYSSALFSVLGLAGFALFQYFDNKPVDDSTTIAAAPMFESTESSTTGIQPEPQKTGPETAVASGPEESLKQTEPESLVHVNTFVEETALLAPAVQTAPLQMKTLSARQQAEHEFAAAEQSMGRGDKARAEQLYRSALATYPGLADARIQLAAILLDRDDNAAAERLLTEGLSLDPTRSRLARLYAQLLASRDELLQALEVVGRATESQPPDADAFALRAAIFARLDRHEDAASDYRLALKLDPEQANWWMGLGLALEHQALYGRASDAYQRASRLPATDSVRAFVHQRLGQIQNISGDG